MSVASVAGAVVGAVLVVSGVLKLASALWPAQARELGAPPVVIPVLPWAEVALGALLVTGIALRLTGALAAVLLAGFTALLVRRLLEGRRPTCGCFGVFSRRPIGPGSVVRNLVLVGLAVVAAAA